MDGDILTASLSQEQAAAGEGMEAILLLWGDGRAHIWLQSRHVFPIFQFPLSPLGYFINC
jgi:hypothetical protein